MFHLLENSLLCLSAVYRELVLILLPLLYYSFLFQDLHENFLFRFPRAGLLVRKHFFNDLPKAFTIFSPPGGGAADREMSAAAGGAENLQTGSGAASD